MDAKSRYEELVTLIKKDLTSKDSLPMFLDAAGELDWNKLKNPHPNGYSYLIHYLAAFSNEYLARLYIGFNEGEVSNEGTRTVLQSVLGMICERKEQLYLIAEKRYQRLQEEGSLEVLGVSLEAYLANFSCEIAHYKTGFKVRREYQSFERLGDIPELNFHYGYEWGVPA